MKDTIFSPAFGNRPQTLVGRTTVINQFRYNLESMPGSRERAMLVLGQRGSGKTVLLLELMDIARQLDYIVASPTITSKGMLDRILEKISTDSERVLGKEKKKIAGGSVSVLGIGAGLQFEENTREKKSFAFRLAEICEQLKEKHKGILILIDEVQANHDELRQLIIAYQEMVGASYNIALVMAGLPGAVSATLNDHVLTFLNRASIISLEPLKINDIDAYYLNAFRKLDVKLSDAGRSYAAEKTLGSPYLMQLIGHYITVYSSDEGMINKDFFEKALCSAEEDFKNDICKTTLNALSETDIAFLSAMSIDPLESKIADIAKRLNVSSAYAQLYRRRLIEAGVIAPARRGEVRFLMPYLKEYLSDENGRY